MNDFTASKFRVGIEIMACNHDPCNDLCYDCEEKNRLIRIEAKLDRLLAIVDKPKVKRKPKEYESASFERWWKVYPKKVGKKACLRLWVNRELGQRVERLILDVNNRCMDDSNWQDEQYILNPHTYLFQERWNDDITPIVQKKETVPRNDIDLWPWAKEHGYPDPGSKTYAQYRQHLQRIHAP
jgi:hypothetical protein